MSLSTQTTSDPSLTIIEKLSIPVRTSLLVLCALSILAVGFLARDLPRQWATNSPASSTASREDRIDRDLSVASASALGDREGVVIVMDPRTGRIRAVVNQRLAFENSFTPGSTMKPFSALAGLRSGMIDKDSRMLCREHFTHEKFKTVCSHPRHLPPFKPVDALAYSCNYYFGKLGEQLPETSFNSTLAEFGFGQPTKINEAGVRESAGALPHRQWSAETALGEGPEIQVTPIQLLTAYVALVNGGHLLLPQIASDAGFVAQQQREISIDDQHRQLILDGMRGAVRYGTAESAKLHSLPLYIFGKTGTATPTGGFRTHGWFVGFASGTDGDPTKPENTRLAVLVFLKRSHGADAAELARPIFESYVQSDTGGNGEGEKGRRGEGEKGRWGDTETRRRGEGETDELEPFASTLVFASPPLPITAYPNVRVSVSSSMRTMTLEEYILGVVAAEGSTETEADALKALAVVSRTYAVKNLRRHEIDGYDFCTTTHCQRYLPTEALAGGRQISAAISRAVRETAGQVLEDREGRIVESYFSASCGGATANISALWGGRSPSYLTGVGDEYCLTMPHHTWRDVISSADLLRALESDAKTKVGGSLTNIAVARRDASGRAELITIDGGRRRTVKGWDFKIVVGRVLGWNLLKSSRFEISRSGRDYVFRGTGFGHGLGLCQEGAHVMARRGVGYQQILAKYFPGTGITELKSLKLGKFAGQEGWFTPADFHHQASGGKPPFLTCEFMPPEKSIANSLRNAGSLRVPITTARRSVHSHHAVSSSPRKLASEYFRLSFPEKLSQRDAEYLLRVFETNRADLIRRVSAAGMSFQLPVLEVFINETTGDFVGRTGQPPWVGAATLRNRIELQPIEVLKKRGILETTIRHELVHSVIEAMGRGRNPRWLTEGMALHLAGEGAKISRYLGKTEISLVELEQRLSQSDSPEEMRAAYAAAYREVKRLIDAQGESAVWRRVAAAG